VVRARKFTVGDRADREWRFSVRTPVGRNDKRSISGSPDDQIIAKEPDGEWSITHVNCLGDWIPGGAESCTVYESSHVSIPSVQMACDFTSGLTN